MYFSFFINTAVAMFIILIVFQVRIMDHFTYKTAVVSKRGWSEYNFQNLICGQAF